MARDCRLKGKGKGEKSVSEVGPSAGNVGGAQYVGVDEVGRNNSGR